jgi:hypothetical protein
MPATPIEERLAALHAHYIRQINASVAAGRMDLVRDLADEYEDESLALLLALEGGPPSRPDLGPDSGSAQILDLGLAQVLDFGGRTPSWHGVGRPGGWRFRFWRRGSR